METTKEQNGLSAGRNAVCCLSSRLVGWLIVPLYVVSDLANYLLTYSVVP